MDVRTDVLQSSFVVLQYAIATFLQYCVLPVKIAKSLFLNTLLIVSANLRSSAVSNALVEGVVSVVEVFHRPGVVFVGELSENVSRDLVGLVVFDDFTRGIFDEDMIQFKLV